MPGSALMPDPVAHIAGWYGKIPALGDFASRRLPPGFISVWDAWLQRGLAASRASLKDRWLDVYLNGPIWRFALLPGVYGDHGWVGIMMPSVDKVGRHFPLTIALELEPHPEIITTLFTAEAWFAAIELVALSSLNMDFLPDQLESRLAATPFPNHPPFDSLEHVAARELDTWWKDPSHVPLVLKLSNWELITDVLTGAGLNLLARTGFGKSMWWSETASGGAAQLHAFSGLPPEHYFTTLLEGATSNEKVL